MSFRHETEIYNLYRILTQTFKNWGTVGHDTKVYINTTWNLFQIACNTRPAMDRQFWTRASS